jgi:hypothetical protein
MVGFNNCMSGKNGVFSIYMRLAAYIAVVLAFGSCATLFNQPTVPVKIYSKTPVHLVINNDTIDGQGQGCEITLNRSKKPLFISAFNDSISSHFRVNAKNSLAFWMNGANLSIWAVVGFAVDWKKPKRYTYPRYVCIDIKDSSLKSYMRDPLFNFERTTKEKFYVNQLKVQPLRLFTDIRGVFVSYERMYKRRYSTELTAAYIFDPFFVKEIRTWRNMYGHFFGLEQKLFIGQFEHDIHYVSLEASYRKFQCDLITYFAIPHPKDSIEEAHLHEDSVKVKHKAYTLNLKFGQQYHYKRFVFDWSIGLGLRYRDVIHENKLHPNDQMRGSRHLNVRDATLGEGEYMLPGFYLGMKIGYRF